MSDELVKRLTQVKSTCQTLSGIKAVGDAIDRIEALNAENARLRERLKPFARIADMTDDKPDDSTVGINISLCRAARSAIKESEG